MRTIPVFALSVLGLTSASALLQAQWLPQSSGTTSELRGLSVPTRNVVWASGARGRYVRSVDGGRSWAADSVPDVSRLDFRAVFAFDASTAFLLSAGPAEGGQANIYSTVDRGAHWTRVYSITQAGVFLDAIAFWDRQHGIAMSDPIEGRWFLLTTADGGRTWTRIPPERIPPVLQGEAAFAASGTCLTVQGGRNVWIGTGGAAKARVFRSTDRGRTWSVAETPVHAGGASAGIFSVAFRDAKRGIVVGGDYQKPKEMLDNIALTDDGGRTWRLARGPMPAGYMSGVAYVPGTSTVVAVGLAGTARSDNGGDRWTMVDTVGYNTVSFATRDRGWAVGPQGRVARWAADDAKRK
jgi:photosystem II stability/assembly factor-like uncharacterized protein